MTGILAIGAIGFFSAAMILNLTVDFFYKAEMKSQIKNLAAENRKLQKKLDKLSEENERCCRFLQYCARKWTRQVNEHDRHDN